MGDILPENLRGHIFSCTQTFTCQMSFRHFINRDLFFLSQHLQLLCHLNLPQSLQLLLFTASFLSVFVTQHVQSVARVFQLCQLVLQRLVVRCKQTHAVQQKPTPLTLKGCLLENSEGRQNEAYWLIQAQLKKTNTRLTALFLGLPGWAGTRKVKPIWILLKQETVSGSGISWATCKSIPHSRQITMPARHHSVAVKMEVGYCRTTQVSKYQIQWKNHPLAQNNATDILHLIDTTVALQMSHYLLHWLHP